MNNQCDETSNIKIGDREGVSDVPPGWLTGVRAGWLASDAGQSTRSDKSFYGHRLCVCGRRRRVRLVRVAKAKRPYQRLQVHVGLEVEQSCACNDVCSCRYMNKRTAVSVQTIHASNISGVSPTLSSSSSSLSAFAAPPQIKMSPCTAKETTAPKSTTTVWHSPTRPAIIEALNTVAAASASAAVRHDGDGTATWVGISARDGDAAGYEVCPDFVSAATPVSLVPSAPSAYK